MAAVLQFYSQFWQVRTWVLAYLLGHHLCHLFCHIALAHVSLVQRRRKSWPIIVSYMALSTELAEEPKTQRHENYATTKQAHCDASRKRIWWKKIFTTRRKTSVAPKKTVRWNERGTRRLEDMEPTPRRQQTITLRTIFEFCPWSDVIFYQGPRTTV